MKNILLLEPIERPRPSHYSSKTLFKDEEGSVIPLSKIDDYQRSMSNFYTRNESDKKTTEKKKKKVEFNPLISVVNIESFKKQNYTITNEDNNALGDNENKCMLCEIF